MTRWHLLVAAGLLASLHAAPPTYAQTSSIAKKEAQPQGKKPAQEDPRGSTPASPAQPGPPLTLPAPSTTSPMPNIPEAPGQPKPNG